MHTQQLTADAFPCLFDTHPNQQNTYQQYCEAAKMISLSIFHINNFFYYFFLCVKVLLRFFVFVCEAVF